MSVFLWASAYNRRLHSFPTRRSSDLSQICTDKTGTLTLNEMTAREVRQAGRRFTVSGQGYATEGRIRTTDGSPVTFALDHAFLAMALCTDAVLHDDDVVGDPTEIGRASCRERVWWR